MSTGACAACGRDFTGLGAFDKHQDVDYSRRPAVTCLDPAAIGLVQNERGRWGFPLDAAGRDYFATLAASRDQDGTPGPPEDAGPSEAATGPRETNQH
jgi:hypothetical protein